MKFLALEKQLLGCTWHLIQHEYLPSGEFKSKKLDNIYSSYESAESASKRLAKQNLCFDIIIKFPKN